MLIGKRILIVEDEAILALDLACTMEDFGAEVLGPCYRLGDALDLTDETALDGAILDVDLAGEKVFPLADRLAGEKIPFVFHTGRNDPAELSGRYANAAVCPKPSTPEEVAKALEGVLVPIRPAEASGQRPLA